MASRGSRSPNVKKNAARRPNKAQQRASQVRSAQTVAAPKVEVAPVVSPREPEVDAAPPRATRRERVTSRPNVRPRPAQSRVVARAVGLTREQEYTLIRADLVRLLITFGLVIVIMFVFLLVVGQ